MVSLAFRSFPAAHSGSPGIFPRMFFQPGRRAGSVDGGPDVEIDRLPIFHGPEIPREYVFPEFHLRMCLPVVFPESNITRNSRNVKRRKRKSFLHIFMHCT